MSKTKQFKYKNAIGQDISVDLAVDAENVETTAFTQATERENLNPGEGLLSIFGKLMKWFSDLKEIAWSGRYADLTDRPVLGNAASANIANNLTTEDEGFALDARQGKTINDSLGGLKFYEDNSGKYVVGADSVPKKLGSGIYLSDITINGVKASASSAGASSTWLHEVQKAGMNLSISDYETVEIGNITVTNANDTSISGYTITVSGSEGSKTLSASATHDVTGYDDLSIAITANTGGHAHRAYEASVNIAYISIY